MSIEKEIEKSKAQKRLRRKKQILAGLVVLLLLIIAIILYLLFAKKPIETLIPGREGPPTYISSIFGDLDWPIGIAVNKKGDRIYVVDSNNQRVKIFDKGGKTIGSLTKESTSEGDQTALVNPLYAAVNSKGDVYVSDRSTASILVFSSSGEYKHKFTPETGAEFSWSPLGLAFDKNDNLYVTDAKKGEHRVLVFGKDRKLKLSFGKEGDGEGEFAFPNGVAVDSKGNIFVADSNNARVQVFDSKGKFLFAVGKGRGKSALSHPMGIAISSQDKVHVTDAFGHTVQVYDNEGKFLYNFGKFGAGEGEFQFPSGIAVSGDRVYVVDREGKRVQVWEY